MKKFILLTVTSTLLSGCAVVQQAQLNSGMQQAEQAMAQCPLQSMPAELNRTWETVIDESMRECPKGVDGAPLPRSQSMEQNQCWINLVNKHVRPIERKPKELDAIIAKSKQVATDYRDGKLDRHASNAAIGVAMTDYVSKQMSYYNYAQCRNTALQQYVMPSYPHKGLLMSFMSHQSQIGMKVDKGEMTVQEADIATQQAFASLLGAEQQANTAIQQKNAQAWQQGFENMQKLEQSNSSNVPRNTNCNVWRNTMSCTSW